MPPSLTLSIIKGYHLNQRQVAFVIGGAISFIFLLSIFFPVLVSLLPDNNGLHGQVSIAVLDCRPDGLYDWPIADVYGREEIHFQLLPAWGDFPYPEECSVADSFQWYWSLMDANSDWGIWGGCSTDLSRGCLLDSSP